MSVGIFVGTLWSASFADFISSFDAQILLAVLNWQFVYHFTIVLCKIWFLGINIVGKVSIILFGNLIIMLNIQYVLPVLKGGGGKVIITMNLIAKEKAEMPSDGQT